MDTFSPQYGDDGWTAAARSKAQDDVSRLAFLVIHNAAQDAACRNRKSKRRQREDDAEVIEARTWLLDGAEYVPTVQLLGGRKWFCHGASVRYLMRVLGIDPDLGQRRIAEMGWQAFCDAMSDAAYGRRRPLEARTGPPRGDRRPGGVEVAEREENRATAA